MKKIFSILIISQALLSCETTIDFEIPREDPKITIDTRIMAGDSLRAFIGTSEYVLSPKNPKLDGKATVYLYENGAKVAELKPRLFSIFNANDSIFYYRTDYIPKPQQVYKLEVSRPGFNTATGQTVVKAPVSVSGVTFDTSSYRVNLTFTDPSGAGDYYRVASYYYINDRQFSLYISSTDRAIDFIDGFEDDPFSSNEESGGEYGYISDEYFDGKSKRITVKINDGQLLPADSLFFEISRINEDFYLHEKSKAASRVSDGFFSEPVQIYNNIENGYGIVAGGSPLRIKL